MLNSLTERDRMMDSHRQDQPTHMRSLLLTLTSNRRFSEGRRTMEANLLAYATAAADVCSHVVFGVAPPVFVHFFRLLSLGFG